jgi:hypothetical protein
MSKKNNSTTLLIRTVNYVPVTDKTNSLTISIRTNTLIYNLVTQHNNAFRSTVTPNLTHKVPLATKSKII